MCSIISEKRTLSFAVKEPNYLSRTLNALPTLAIIACSINDVTSSGLTIYSSFAFIWNSISVCLTEVCTINSNREVR